MSDIPSRPAGPARQAVAPPARQAKPVELLPGDMKTRAPEELRLARPRMHPIQRRPVASQLDEAKPREGDVDNATGATPSSSPARIQEQD